MHALVEAFATSYQIVLYISQLCMRDKAGLCVSVHFIHHDGFLDNERQHRASWRQIGSQLYRHRETTYCREQ